MRRLRETGLLGPVLEKKLSVMTRGEQMLKRPILLILCAILMTTVACGANIDKQDEDDGQISKQEAESKNDGVDYCDTLKLVRRRRLR